MENKTSVKIKRFKKSSPNSFGRSIWFEGTINFFNGKNFETKPLKNINQPKSIEVRNKTNIPPLTIFDTLEEVIETIRVTVCPNIIGQDKIASLKYEGNFEDFNECDQLPTFVLFNTIG